MVRHGSSTRRGGVGESQEVSNLHYPTSCYRPAQSDIVARASAELPGGTWVDWPALKQQAWAFLALPYDGEAALDFVCPAWWNATACECDCGDCSELFKACPVGFMLFRALALLCAARGNANLRLHVLVQKQWGSGLVDFGKAKLAFKDILHSGWPYFGVLSRVAEQLKLDGVTEVRALQIARITIGLPVHPESPSYCAGLGWWEDREYLAFVSASLNEPDAVPVPLERSIRAAAAVGACPLQRAVAHAATADWLLQPGTLPSAAIRGAGGAGPTGANGEAGWLTPESLVQVEDFLGLVQNDILEWASFDAGMPQGRPYFFEMLVVAWPLWRLLHRIGNRFLGAFALERCTGASARGPAADVGIRAAGAPPHTPVFSTSAAPALGGGARGAADLICPACSCSTQGEWAVEARYVAEYAEGLGEVLFLKRARELALAPAGNPWRLPPLLASQRLRRWVVAPGPSWRQRWAALTAPPRRPSAPSASAASAARGSRREAFATVLFVRGSKLDKVLLHVEAIRVLAFSAKQRSLRQRPFLVVTDEKLPEVADAALQADGLTVVQADPGVFSFATNGAAYGADDARASRLQLQSWWMERGVAPTAIKLAIWNFTQYDCLVFLDADTLILDSVDELFEMRTFASGLTPYSTHGITEMIGEKLTYKRRPGFNTGVMVLQPSAEVAATMAEEMAAGVHDNSPIAEHVGQSDQPWLDAFFLAHSHRLGLARFSAPRRGRGRGRRFLGCDPDFQVHWGEATSSGSASSSADGRTSGAALTFAGDDASALLRRPWPQPARRKATQASRRLVTPTDASRAHCVLPLEYDFFADYKAVRTHVWYEARERARNAEAEAAEQPVAGPQLERNMSDIEWSIRRYVEHYDVLGSEGIKILHWPGELRKPWERWHRAVRSPWDEAWWAAHRAMCARSAAPCHIRC